MNNYVLLLVLLANFLPSEGRRGKGPGYSGRIVNGNGAIPHSWPWQVSIQKNGNHKCGGSLISQQWVLTAAHCVHKDPNPDIYRIVVGIHSLNKNSLYTETKQVQRIIKHEFYKEATLQNDIALMKLKTPIKQSLGVKPVLLPSSTTSPPPGWMCYATGWGSTCGGSPSSITLQEAVVPIVDHTTCAKKMRGYIVIEQMMVCAGGKGKGCCHGDSGGPLVCNHIGKWFLRGVVSWGDDNCRTSYYTVFARVEHYVPWINCKIHENAPTETDL